MMKIMDVLVLLAYDRRIAAAQHDQCDIRTHIGNPLQVGQNIFILDAAVDIAVAVGQAVDVTVLDRLDQESLEFHERVYDGYRQVIRKYADRMIIIDANRAVEEVIEDAYQAVKGLLDA